MMSTRYCRSCRENSEKWIPVSSSPINYSYWTLQWFQPTGSQTRSFPRIRAGKINMKHTTTSASTSDTLPETKSSHLKIDGWNMMEYVLVSCWGPGLFPGSVVTTHSNYLHLTPHNTSLTWRSTTPSAEISVWWEKAWQRFVRIGSMFTYI